MGRPPTYDPQFAEQARKLCELGATDDEIAQFFDVSARTVYRWKLDHPEFCQALKAGKANADDRMERSLYQRGTGFRYIEQQAIKIKTGPHTEKIEIVDVERLSPPDTTAAIFWLKNRRAADWRDKTEQVATQTLRIERIEYVVVEAPQPVPRLTNGNGHYTQN